MPQITVINSDGEEDDEVAMGPGAALREATKRKDAGNARFKAGDYAAACLQYSQAIKCLDRWTEGSGKDAKEMTVACLSNRAAAYIKVERYREAVADCSRALGLQPAHAKAVFRRAQAYEALANRPGAPEAEFRDLIGRAADDTQRLVVLEPTNKDAKRALTRLRGMLDPQPPEDPTNGASSEAAATPLPPPTAAPDPEPTARQRLTTCELCRIGHRQLPAQLVYEDNLFMAFKEKAAASTWHFIIASRVHLPTADKLLPRHVYHVEHMQILAHRLLKTHGADLSDALIGCHLPPAVSGSHLYLHAVSPVANISTWDWSVRFSRLAFQSVGDIVQRLEAIRP